MGAPFNILAVVQGGRLQYEALLLAASHAASGTEAPLILAEPQPGPKWKGDPRIQDPDIRARLLELGARIVPFENHVFGSAYPHGNKIIALTALPEGEPFLFLDTDTLILEPLHAAGLSFDRPTASMRREGSWPEIDLYGPRYADIWRALHERFGLDFAQSLDLAFPEEDWQRYLYFNAGWFTGPCPHRFADLYSHFAAEIRRDPGKALEGQALYPWLDQIALPLVIHALNGGRPVPPESGLDGVLACHWRTLPLLYAREEERVVTLLETLAEDQKTKKLLRRYEPFKKMIYGGKGRKARALFEGQPLPTREAPIRKRLKAANLWMR